VVGIGIEAFKVLSVLEVTRGIVYTYFCVVLGVQRASIQGSKGQIGRGMGTGN
jgi:hypothetical protein